MAVTYKKDIVSIGLTTFNRPKHLRKAVERLLSQTYAKIEILISDDNPESKENYEAIKDLLDDPRLTYHKKLKNEGMNLNFSSTLAWAKGEYFMWAADDDYWELDFVQNCVNELKKNKKAALCITSSSFIEADYSEVGLSKEDINTMGLSEMDRFKKYFRNSQIHNVGFYGVYRTELLKMAYLPNYLSNDRLVLLELSLKGEFIQLPMKGFYYNVSGGSKSIDSYLNAMKIKSKLIKYAPHLAFNLLHVYSILFCWSKINLVKRIILLGIYYNLIKENGYLKNSIKQIRRNWRILLNPIV